MTRRICGSTFPPASNCPASRNKRAKPSRSGSQNVASGTSVNAGTFTSLTNHAVLVGYGRVGSLVAGTLQNAGQPYLIIEERQSVVDQLRGRGDEIIAGNAAQSGMLEAANIASAKWLISAIPNPFESGNLIEQAHAVNPKLEIIARAHSDAEVEYLKRFGANLIIMGEREIARGISEHILRRIDPPTAPVAGQSENAGGVGTKPMER